jgi:hypothetical protein
MGPGLIKAFKSPIILTLFGLTALYWIIAYFTEFENWIVFMNAILLWVAITVLISYVRPVCLAIERGRVDKVDYLILGIVASWVAQIASRMWSTIYRATGQPNWMFESDILGYIIFIYIIGGVLHITAPGTIGGKVPHRNWIKVGFAVSTGAVLAATLIWYRLWSEGIVSSPKW